MSSKINVSGQKIAHRSPTEGDFYRILPERLPRLLGTAADTGPAAGLMPFHSPAQLPAHDGPSPAMSPHLRKYRSVTSRISVPS